MPTGALEAIISDRVSLWDVSPMLERTPNEETRDPDAIRFLIVHKTGANGRAGLVGLQDCVRYVVHSRGFPGPAYTFWLAQQPDLDAMGRFVIYRCQPDTAKSWHTGHGMNGIGVGAGLQGNYDSQWDLLSDGLPKIEIEPTAAQMVMLDALVTYCETRYPKFKADQLDGADWLLTGHWEHGKPVCPGDAVRLWIMRRRGQTIGPAGVGPALPPPRQGVDPYRPSPAQLQAALKRLNYYAGEIDGSWGFQSRDALERFQKASGLEDDGVYGPKTAAALEAAHGFDGA
jgi:hypothetical protein